MNAMRTLRRLMALVVALCAGSALAQDAPVTFTPTADAYVLDGAWSGSNFGADVWLYTKTSNGQNYDSYLKFDTTGVGTAWRAKLRFNGSVSANANIGVTAYSVGATGWSESAITWNNKPARGAALGNVTVTGTSFAYYEIDVTNYVAAEKAAGRHVVSFALHNAQNSNQYVWMRSREAGSNSPQLVITPNVTVVSLLPALSTVALGASTTLTLTLSSAQATDTVVPIAASPAGIVSVPAQVTVPAGQRQAPLPVGTLAYGQAGITASLNGSSASAGVNVVPPPVAVSALEPATFVMTVAAVSTFTVRINAAQVADTEITLAASNPAVLQVPASVTVPAGASSATFTATGLAVGDSTITATANGTSQVSSVHVSPQPAAIASLLPTPLPLQQGATGSLAVTINVAQEVATTIALTNTAPEVATVPESVVIAAGAVSAQIPVTALTPGNTVITASVNATSATATVEVTPPPPVVAALTPETLGLAKGTPGTLRVTVSRAPNAVTPVALVSSDPAIASVPAQVNIPAGALYADFPVMPNAAGQASITASLNGGSAASNVTVGPAELVSLALAPQAPARFVGETVTFGATGTMTDGTSEDFTSRVTWSSSVPAVAAINAAGVASALGAGETTIRAAFTFTAAQTGQPVTIEQSTPLSVQIQFAITGFTPASGPVGTAVAISGVGFDANLSGNQVKVNGEPAVIASGSTTLLNVIVPPRATTGPITVTNFRGTVASATPFTVQEREAFDITLAPAAIQVPPGGVGGTRIRLASTGLNPYPYAASVVISGLPAGVTATLDRATVALNQDAVITFSAAAGAGSGAFTITLTASGASGVTTQTVTKTLGVEVLAAGGTTVTGRVLHADDGAPFVGARVRLGVSGPHVFTDESGTYRFVSPPVLGDQVLLIDGNTNNTAQFEFPSGIAMPVMILAGQDNRVITSHIGRVDATKFTNVVPGQAASVTEADIPSFSLNIQPGQTIIGWDGQPVTKINVRKVSVDRLPIRPIPEGWDTRSVYLFYFFREGGGTPTTPIPVSLPNDLEALPGEQITLWYYDESPTPDPTSNQWRVLGTGTVSQDGKTIVSDPGFGMPKFCCGAVWGGRSGGGNTGNNGGNGCGPSSPNPVDLASGNAMVFRPRPFGISKFMALDPNCRYRSTDARPGLFGRGFSFTYDWFAEQVGLSVRVANPQGVQFMLAREADGIYRSRSGRSGSIEMEVTPTATGRTLRLADGTRFEFNAPGRLLAIQDVAGNRTTFELDALGLLFSMTDPAGKVYEFQTSGAGQAFRIDRITDPVGRFIQFTYDGSRNLIAYRDQGGNVTQFGYTGSRISQVTDPRTAVKTIEYDPAGRAVRETLPENAEERYAYTAVGSTVAETRYTDANGKVTTYRFSGLGFETQMVDALGRVTKTELDPVTSQVKRRIDPAGRVTQYFYNSRGDVIRIVDADNKEVKIEYDTRFRNVTRLENALGHVSVMAYNAQGNMTSFTSAENETSTFTYTLRGQLETVTDPLLRVTRFTYDVNGNLTNSTNTADEAVTRIYDSANRVVELVDSLNRTTRFTYDSLDRVAEVRDAANGIIKLAYDANDNLLSAHDQNNNPVERNVYDLRNRLKTRTDAKNRATTYDYDGVGNLIRITDRKGQIAQYTYDAINRLIRMQDHDGRVTTYAYDLAGNLAQLSDTQSGDILMSYDALDRLTEVVTPQGRVAYTYDAIGRRTSRALSGGDVTMYTYDNVNRIKTVTLRDRTVSYAYDAVGRLSERRLPNGIKVAYAYDDADRVTSIAYRKTDDSPIETVTYSYDTAGRRTSRGDGQVAPQDTTFSASYDEANRLTAIVLNGEAFTLAYDDNGNLVSKAGTTSGTTVYTWNARDQLVALFGPSGSANFKYDAFGRRIEKTVNGQTTGFIYDEAQAVAELNGSAIDTVYHTGVSIDEVLARYAPLGNKILLTDALKSVIAQTNDDQSVANFYAYSAYGEATALGPDGGNSLQYTSREDDGGLYYYRARYYDPVLKRFISADPIAIEGGINLYTYVGGDPISFFDPNGLLMTWWNANLRPDFDTGTGLPQDPTQQAVQVGGMGNNAMAAGFIPIATAGAGYVAIRGGVAAPAFIVRNALQPSPMQIVTKAISQGVQPAGKMPPTLPPPPVPVITRPAGPLTPAPTMPTGKPPTGFPSIMGGIGGGVGTAGGYPCWWWWPY